LRRTWPNRRNDGAQMQGHGARCRVVDRQMGAPAVTFFPGLVRSRLFPRSKRQELGWEADSLVFAEICEWRTYLGGSMGSTGQSAQTCGSHILQTLTAWPGLRTSCPNILSANSPRRSLSDDDNPSSDRCTAWRRTATICVSIARPASVSSTSEILRSTSEGLRTKNPASTARSTRRTVAEDDRCKALASSATVTQGACPTRAIAAGGMLGGRRAAVSRTMSSAIAPLNAPTKLTIRSAFIGTE